MRLSPSIRSLAALACLAAVAVPLACGSDDDSLFNGGAGDGGAEAAATGTGFGEGNVDATTTGEPDDGGSDASAQIVMTIRDFRFYDAGDPLTDPDFENPPYNILPDGGSKAGYAGDWDDPNIVEETLGSDGKPVYKPGASGRTVTTHGLAAFARWYNNVDGGNVWQDIPLVTTSIDGGAVEYDSNKVGQPNDPLKPDGSRGFFPIDDGTTYATSFGNQGRSHNYSFTGEIHAAFTYRGGESFYFRGDDDVWVFIDKKLVINIGGIHSPETRSVSVDTLGLTVGKDYPLDFFFAERHVTGSNILFQTTLALRAAPPGGLK